MKARLRLQIESGVYLGVAWSSAVTIVGTLLIATLQDPPGPLMQYLTGTCLTAVAALSVPSFIDEKIWKTEFASTQERLEFTLLFSLTVSITSLIAIINYGTKLNSGYLPLKTVILLGCLCLYSSTARKLRFLGRDFRNTFERIQHLQMFLTKLVNDFPQTSDKELGRGLSKALKDAIKQNNEYLTILRIAWAKTDQFDLQQVSNLFPSTLTKIQHAFIETQSTADMNLKKWTKAHEKELNAKITDHYWNR